MAEVQAVPEWVVEWLDPRTLLTDKNVREVRPDQDMVASVRALGVLMPIVAVRTAEGQIRVRFGENRTRAAILAERSTVPVIVVGEEDGTQADEIARIISQRAENTYRKGMTKSEDAAAARQLSLLGLSDDQIAEDLRMPKATVKASKVIAGSAVATQILDEYDLDLTQLAVIAKFDGNQARVDELVKKARNGWGFDQAVERMRTEDKDAAARRAFAKSLKVQGLRVVDEQPSYARGPLMYLSDLYDGQGRKLDPGAHKSCPGDAVVIEEVTFYITADGTEFRDEDDVPDEHWDGMKSEDRLVPEPVCDQAEALHLPAKIEPDPEASEDEQERAEREAREAAAREAREAAERQRAKEQRARVIAGNKEWDAAVRTRRNWVAKFLKRKTAPAGTTAFVWDEFARAPHHLTQAFQQNHPLSPTLLGFEVENDTSYFHAGRVTALRALAGGTSDKRLMVLILGLIMTANENSLTRQSWRGDHGCAEKGYLRFIIGNGYEACETERLAAGLNAAGGNEPEAVTEEAEEQQTEAPATGEESAAETSDGDQEGAEVA